MTDAAKQFILDHLPASIAIIVILVCALIFFVWWAAIMWVRLKNAPCQKHEEFIERHTDKIDGMANSLSKIEGKLEMLIRMVPQTAAPYRESLLSDDKPALAQKNSPKTLNPNGEKVSETFGCRAFLEANKDWLLSEVSKFNPKTALDVEMSSLYALRVASSDERFNNLKDLIYNSPKIDLRLPTGDTKNVEVTLEDVLFVISLPLRDLYLQRHPEITMA